MKILRILSVVIVVSVSVGVAMLFIVDRSSAEEPPNSQAFTYQGRLTLNNEPVTDVCDFQFGLFDAVAGGDQKGETVLVDGTSVVGGLFTTQLNFGNLSAFDGSDRWLDIAAKCGAEAGFTPLTPRQAITASPYAILAYGLPDGATLTANTGPASITGTGGLNIDGNVGIGKTNPSVALAV